MKTEEQIRARVAELKRRLDTPTTKRRSNTALVALVQAEDALRWVLDENDEEPLSLQATIDRETA